MHFLFTKYRLDFFDGSDTRLHFVPSKEDSFMEEGLLLLMHDAKSFSLKKQTNKKNLFKFMLEYSWITKL